MKRFVLFDYPAWRKNHFSDNGLWKKELNFSNPTRNHGFLQVFFGDIRLDLSLLGDFSVVCAIPRHNWCNRRHLATEFVESDIFFVKMDGTSHSQASKLKFDSSPYLTRDPRAAKIKVSRDFVMHCPIGQNLEAWYSVTGKTWERLPASVVFFLPGGFRTLVHE